MKPVIVEGRGIAGAAAAYCLAVNGIPVHRIGSPRSAGHWITLNEYTWNLITDLFGAGFGELCHSRVLTRRIVDWTGCTPPLVVEGPMRVVHTNRLAETMDRLIQERYATRVTDGGVGLDKDGSGGYRILALGRGYKASDRMFSGERAGRVWCDLPFSLGHPDTILVKSLQEMWLFALPQTTGGVFLAVFTPSEPKSDLEPVIGQVAEALAKDLKGIENELSVSPRALSETLRARATSAKAFVTAPSILAARPQDGIFPTGDALMTLDPISGDGIGSAIRSAVLAAASVSFLVDHPTYGDRIQRHFTVRTAAALASHLGICDRYYRDIRHAAAWRGERQSAGVFSERIAHLAEPGQSPFYLNRTRLFRSKYFQKQGNSQPLPYRTGVTAGARGCLGPFDRNTPRAQDAVAGWASAFRR